VIERVPSRDWCEYTQASARLVAKNTAARTAVVRLRNVAEPRAPNSVCDAPLPKAAPCRRPCPAAAAPGRPARARSECESPAESLSCSLDLGNTGALSGRRGRW